MASLYKRSGSKKWFMRFEYRGRTYRQSTGEEDKRKARKVMNREIAKLKGDMSVDSLVDQVLNAIQKLPEKEQEKKRCEVAQRIVQGVESQVTIADAWKTWLRNPKKRNPSDKTLYAYKGRWQAFQKWVRKKHRHAKALHEVTSPMAEQYASQLWGSGVSPSTYNLHINFLKGMFRVLKVQAGLAQNVWLELPTMGRETESRRELKPEELQEVCRTAKGDLRYMFALGLYTGMRLGDVCMLKWEEVDLENRIIEHVPMKTKRLNKIVRLPIHPVLEALLVELRKKKRKRNAYVLPKKAEQYMKDSAGVSKEIQAHFEANGIKTREEPTNGHRKKAIVRVGFHSLRHSFVSLCAANNVPQVAIMELVGHGSPAMTRLYSHAGDEQKTKAIAGLPDITSRKKK